MIDRNRLPRLLAGVVVLVLASLSPLRADDRALLRSSSANPYVFVILDTSGSMNWAAPCSASDYAAGNCNYLCPTGDCWVPRNADDTASKFRQAKEALAEVIAATPNVNFGFGTYNQDHVAILNKHWRYIVRASQPNGFITLNTGHAFPVAGASEVFGPKWSCTSGSTVGCQGSNPAAFTDFSTGSPAAPWNQLRMYELPKGQSNAETQTFYIRDTDGRVYKVSYQVNGGQTVGSNTLQATVTVGHCIDTKNPCTANSAGITGSPKTIYFDLDGAGQFVDWDFDYQAAAPQNGFFQQDIIDSAASNTCGGWDPDTDTTADTYTDSGGHSYDMKWPTDTSPESGVTPVPGASVALMDNGDVMPLDWRTDHRNDILQRLAPDGTTAAGEGFSIAKYFNDTRQSGDQFLRLQNSSQRPLMANGSTPLGFTIGAWRTWYSGCNNGSCPKLAGWRDLAAANDADWGCRKVYLLVLTDGDDTCPGRDPCSDTAALKALFDVKTYVVAFGVQSQQLNPQNKLTCMAANGGTGKPIMPQNKQDLVNVLNDIFGQIKEQAASFSSAAVPSVQAQVADKVYLTNFVPLNGSSIWYGHLDTYLKPVPLKNGVPDKTATCGSTGAAECFAWDGQAQMLGNAYPAPIGGTGATQVPTAAQVAGGTYMVGPGAGNRRVYYPEQAPTDGIPVTRHYLLPPPATPTAQKYDLWTGMGITFTPGNTSSESAANTAATNVLDFTLEQKQSTVDNPDGTKTNITFILGDIFHSDPQVIGNPGQFRYFAPDLYGNGKACDDATDPNRGYRCFFNTHRCRRKMVFVGSNDGELHAFDAGQFTVAQDATGKPVTLDCSPAQMEVQGRFDNGTGKELFSFVPRPMLKNLVTLTNTTSQTWGVDGTVEADDVFIDPIHSGTPTPSERQWRTILLGGFREGGTGYYALDITQPDTLDSKLVPQPSAGYVPSCSGDPSLPTSCGPLPFATELWEFQDAWDEDPPGSPGAGFPDLAATWSVPESGRILVCEGTRCDPTTSPNDLKDHFVAIFGGGLDPNDLNKPFFRRSGNYVYIVDVETGKAIYKRRVDGSVPSEVAAVDTNQDGYIDTVYVGTTTGYMYKIDLSTPALLQTTAITEYSTGAAVVRTVSRVMDSAWAPFKIFDTTSDAVPTSTSPNRKPIYYPPSVIYYPKATNYVLAWGTGNREDLWKASTLPGRFYVIVDANLGPVADGAVLTETSFAAIDPVFSGSLSTDDFLLNPAPGMKPGWYFFLDPGERVITKSFALAGIVTFSSYVPKTIDDPDTKVCSKGGDSHIFTVLVTNANPVQKDPTSGLYERYRLVPVFTTSPYTEQSETANKLTTAPPPLSPEEQDVMKALKDLQPSNCRFANYRIDIKTIRSDTGIELIAPVPICMVQKNWREF